MPCKVGICEEVNDVHDQIKWICLIFVYYFTLIQEAYLLLRFWIDKMKVIVSLFVYFRKSIKCPVLFNYVPPLFLFYPYIRCHIKHWMLQILNLSTLVCQKHHRFCISYLCQIILSDGQLRYRNTCFCCSYSLTVAKACQKMQCLENMFYGFIFHHCPYRENCWAAVTEQWC